MAKSTAAPTPKPTKAEKAEETPKVDPVKESIDGYVTKHPFLAESRALLERETSVEQVAKVAEALVQMVQKASPKVEESKVEAKVEEVLGAGR